MGMNDSVVRRRYSFRPCRVSPCRPLGANCTAGGRKRWARGYALAALLLLGATSTPATAQRYAPPADAVSVTQSLEPLIRQLLQVIEMLSEYRAGLSLPPVFVLPQPALEALVCEDPCNVSAAFLPGHGVFLAEHLDPMREPRDRAALLHELVHALQQGHAKFADLPPCERERAKEQEAYAMQNAYLASFGSAAHVVFYDGEFDCEGEEAVRMR